MHPFIKTIPQIFFSRSFYADLLARGKGIGIGFILLQMLLTLAVPGIMLILDAPKVKIMFQSVAERLPEITIKDYSLTMDQPSPYIIGPKENTDKKLTIVFDTSSSLQEVSSIQREMDTQKAFVLVTSDYIAFRKNRGGIEIHAFKDYGAAVKDISVNHDKWIALADKLFTWGYPCVLLGLVFFTFVGSLVINFFRAFLVKLIALFFKDKPDLSGAMRLSAAAAIPFSVVSFLAAIIGVMTAGLGVLPLPFYLVALCWLGYVIYGLVAFNKERKPAM